MRTKLYLFTFLLVSVFLVSCRRSLNGVVIERPEFKIALGSNEKSNSLSEFISDLKIVKLQGPNGLIFSETGNQWIVFAENKFIVFDKKLMSIKVFNKDGVFLNSIGKLGISPGSFIRIESVVYDPFRHVLAALCNNPAKICSFSLDGTLVGEKNIDFFATSFAIPSANEYVFWVNQNRSKTSGDNNILITDSSNQMKARLFDFPKNISSSIIFSGGLFQYDGRVYYTPAFSNRYYVISGDSAKAIYEIDYGKKNIPDGITEPDLFGNLTKYSFQYETFIKAGDMIGFNYLDRKVGMAWCNFKSGEVIKGDIQIDSLNVLFQNSTFYLSNNRYVTVLNGKKVAGFIGKNRIKFEKAYPSIFKELSELNPQDYPTLLIYSLRLQSKL